MREKTTFMKDGDREDAWIIMQDRKRRNRNFYMLRHEMIDYMLEHKVSPAGLLLFLWMVRNATPEGVIRKWSYRRISIDLNCSYFKVYSGIQSLIHLRLLDNSEINVWRLETPLEVKYSEGLNPDE